LTIISIVATGNFVATNDCGTSVAVGAMCTITVAFKPVVAGASGTLIITDDAPGSPQSTGLTGPNVLPPSAILAPTTLTFASQAVGTTSPAQTVTLTNPINGISLPLIVTATSIAGIDFAVAKNGCQQPIPSGTSCTITLTFTPSATGSRSALFSIFDNAVTSSQTVALRGSGR
jgi:ASPM-SPD-2-Hydin domain-containing protein